MNRKNPGTVKKGERTIEYTGLSHSLFSDTLQSEDEVLEYFIKFHFIIHDDYWLIREPTGSDKLLKR